jgi:anti-sigma regulatory factor (Ser/Thr protein kinase)
VGIRADVPAAGFHQMFEPVPSSVGRARMFARGLHEHLPENTQACLELVVSELATNAVVHAASPYEVAVSAGPPIRVEVSDASSDPPVMQRPAVDGMNGRGLRLVDACALQWGYVLTPQGKVVWAELRS